MDVGTGSYNGLSFGTNTKFHVKGIQGFDDMPGVRSSDADRAQDQGQFIGIDYLTGRDITLDFHLIGNDHTDYLALVEQFRNAFLKLDTATELPLLLFNSAYLVNGRVEKRAMPYDAENLPRVGDGSVLIHCTDPRFYAATQQNASTSLPASNGGAAWPWVWPVSWGSSSGSGTFVANNAGNYESRPVITITGPVDNPTVANLTTGLSMTFAITLANTDSLVIDMLNRTVVLNGTASRRNTVVAGSNWWNLPPGNSTVAYNANTVQVGSTMQMAWRSAWI